MAEWLPEQRNARPSLQLVVLLAVLWLALAGPAEWLFGIVAVGLALAASHWLAPMQLTRFSLPGLARFLPYFVAQSVAGGVDVARRALAPGPPLAVHDSRYAMALPPGQARTVFIGAISLLPGTLARDVDNEGVRVHSIAGDPRASLDALERRVANLFGISLGDR